jgi:hypothetical protein
MPEAARILLIVASAIALAWFIVACLRAVSRSRRLQAELRGASPEERRLLEARMEAESEIGAYMFPVPAREYVPGLLGVAGLVVAKALGCL